MFGSAILEVAAGVIFIYILVCVICSAVREGIEGWLKTRAAYLEHGIRELLHDPEAKGIVTDFFNHPLIFGLFSNKYTPLAAGKGVSIFARGRNLPSYIPAENFAVTVMDLAARGPQTDALNSDPNGPALSLDSMRANISNLNNPAVQRVLLSALDAAQGDIVKVRKSLEAWYDSGMDRVSGKYKRSTQWIILGIALIVAVGMNVNTITIADYLFRNDAARAAVVATAENAAATDAAKSAENYKQVQAQLNSMNLPIGWGQGWGAPKPKQSGEPWNSDLWNNLVAPITGWLLTAFAATMGAPFWFDMLNKVMVIRSTVKPHEKSPEEASEDRQTILPAAKQPVQSVAGVQQTRSAPAAPRLPSLASSPRDSESSTDGCDADIINPTSDQDLPAAQGGVA